MSEPDYDDPAVDERWCADMRAQVLHYLANERLPHGAVGEWPAWHVAPYVAVWAIESKAKPGWVGWWAICGDLPTDYLVAGSIRHPRQALEAFAVRWQQYAARIHRGATAPDFRIPGVEASPSLLPLLESRAKTLLDWAADDAIWADR